MKWKSLSCARLCNSMDCTIHGILQTRILEWVAFPFSKGSSRPRNKPRSHALQADSLPAEPQGKLRNTGMGSLSHLCDLPDPGLNWGLLHCRQILCKLSYQGINQIKWKIHLNKEANEAYISSQRWLDQIQGQGSWYLCMGINVTMILESYNSFRAGIMVYSLRSGINSEFSLMFFVAILGI